MSRTRAPYLTVEGTVELLGSMRETGKRIVFTNGCFDIIHPGHMEILEQAASMGDFLVVGLNTDQSVKRLKGESRPVNTLEDRIAVLSCIIYVDCLVSFDTDTPLGLIRTLRPDVLVKGGDYSLETIVGAREVLDGGGSVEVVPLLKGYSSTAIIEGEK